MYHSKIIKRNSRVTMAALKYESSVVDLKCEGSNDVFPNFLNYTDSFKLCTQDKCKQTYFEQGLSQNVRWVLVVGNCKSNSLG